MSVSAQEQLSFLVAEWAIQHAPANARMPSQFACPFLSSLLKSWVVFLHEVGVRKFRLRNRNFSNIYIGDIALHLRREDR